MKKQGWKEAEIKKSSQIYNLDSYLDEDNIKRVGGVCITQISKGQSHIKTHNRMVKFGEQKMAKLPFDKLQEEPLFIYCGVGLFWSFVICSKQKKLKCYRVMFTCHCRRVIHAAHSLDTDSFLMTLRRFKERRDNIRQMKSDNGSDFVGAVKELRKSS